MTNTHKILQKVVKYAMIEKGNVMNSCATKCSKPQKMMN